MNIAVFYHCLFGLKEGKVFEEKPAAFAIVHEFVSALRTSGLLDEAQEVFFGVNGGPESEDYAKISLPPKAKMIFHGLDSRAENLTICHLHEWCRTHPRWAVLYAHAKGCTHPPESPYATGVSAPWRQTMTQYLVGGWRESVAQLEAGADIACCHWLWGMADGTQHIPAGNFLWTTSDFVASLPSMHQRERIKQSGIAAKESRYEAEVFWGNGRRPAVFQWLPNGGGGVP